jgi:2',3'-cyclic-nucleotide 2'-phosphodiesterase/3'-nucleotidase
VDLTLARKADGSWTLEGTSSRLLPVLPDTPADPEILEIARPYHEAAERFLDQPVTEAAAALSGARGRFEDSALVDAIQEVQMHYAKAEVSFASLFDPRVRVPRGKVTARELAALYVYDNELYAVLGTGRMVREALENAARYFRTCPDPSCARGPLVDGSVAGYNFDMAQGVEYQIDLRKPEGHRVEGLRFRGQPLRDDQPLRIALNNYRAAGSAGYSMFRGARVVWRSGREIRDLMVEYFADHRSLPETPDGNWRLVPTRAVETLVLETATAR